MCSYSGCNLLAYVVPSFLLGEDVSTYTSSLAYYVVTNPVVCHDKLVNQQFAASSGLLHDGESSYKYCQQFYH